MVERKGLHIPLLIWVLPGNDGPRVADIGTKQLLIMNKDIDWSRATHINIDVALLQLLLNNLAGFHETIFEVPLELIEIDRKNFLDEPGHVLAIHSVPIANRKKLRSSHSGVNYVSILVDLGWISGQESLTSAKRIFHVGIGLLDGRILHWLRLHQLLLFLLSWSHLLAGLQNLNFKIGVRLGVVDDNI